MLCQRESDLDLEIQLPSPIQYCGCTFPRNFEFYKIRECEKEKRMEKERTRLKSGSKLSQIYGLILTVCYNLVPKMRVFACSDLHTDYELNFARQGSPDQGQLECQAMTSIF